MVLSSITLIFPEMFNLMNLMTKFLKIYFYLKDTVPVFEFEVKFLFNKLDSHFSLNSLHSFYFHFKTYSKIPQNFLDGFGYDKLELLKL